MRLQVHLSDEPDSERAPAIAHDQWREACIGSGVGWELEMPEEFEQVGAYIRPEDVRESVLVTDDLGWLPESIAAMGELGADEIDLHGAGQDQDAFLEATGSRLLPALTAGL